MGADNVGSYSKHCQMPVGSDGNRVWTDRVLDRHRNDDGFGFARKFVNGHVEWSFH